LPDHSESFDLLRRPGIGRLLRWRHARTFFQIPLLIVSVALILDGLFGPTLAPKNLATTLSWVHFRGALVLVLLCAGNFFCFACPFMLVRGWMRHLILPRWNWPRRLRNKWLSIGLLVLILFAYELFDLWSSPWWTAWLIVTYFVAALLVDGAFKHASFCKFVCPIGQFNFVASLVSPLEVKVRDEGVCSACATRDCIRGRRADTAPLVRIQPAVVQRGCELALFQPLKAGNMDCTFCLDCVQACPHDNVGILSRLPASELMTDPPRSGIGLFSRRKDIAALVIVFTFGALINAFGMVKPAYAVETWMGGFLHVRHEAPILGIIFAAFLIVGPGLLIGMAAWSMRGSGSLFARATRYSYGLAPLGFGIWLAHYSFHFLTGLYTFIPVTQRVVWPVLGDPRWRLTGIPARIVQPVELGFLVLGLAGSLLVTMRLAQDDSTDRPMRVFAPWAVVCGLIFSASLWLMFQPMEMRGVFLPG
jgi:hypothetical protein